MKVGAARQAAVDWVLHDACHQEGFSGAYFSGSTLTLPAEAELPATSDVDVMVVTTKAVPPPKLGKFVYHDALLEVTYIPAHQLASAQDVLASYHLAGSFRIDTIITDPTGDLHSLYATVSRLFAERTWVRRRCENARQKIEDGLRTIDITAPWHDQVTAWLFPTGVTTHVLLVAALRNPTVRLRYLAARNVLAEYGYVDMYEELLDLLGCMELTPQQVKRHLSNLAKTMDAAAAIVRTPFFFSSDITTPEARQIALDGSLDLIQSGYHREAIFWIVATFARCHKMLAADAPQERQRQLAPAFDYLLADLGITSSANLLTRASRVLHFLPKLWKTTEAILASNPEIRGNASNIQQ